MKMRWNQLVAAMGAAAMVGTMMPATAFGATLPASPDATATITVGKTVDKDANATWPSLLSNGFDFKLTPEKATINNGSTMTAAEMPMPATATGWTAPTTAGEGGIMNVGGFANSGTTPATQQEKTANIPDITFTKAGAYMYTLEEVKPTAADKIIAGVNYDTTKYYVVVYVTNVVDADTNVPTGAVTIKNITAWEDDITDLQWADQTVTDNGGADADPDLDAGKVGISEGTTPGTLEYPFVNPYGTSDLTVTKTVTGDLGDKENHFDFTVTITEGLTVGQDYTVKFYDGSTEIADDATETDAKAGSTATALHANQTVTGGADGSATFTAKLKHGEKFTILGLPAGAKYTVTEAANNHTASLAASEAATDDTALTDEQKTKANGAKDTVLTSAEITVDKTNDTIDFTNNRVSPTLTGVILQVLPFVGIAVVAIAGLAAMLIFRKRNGAAQQTGRY